MIDIEALNKMEDKEIEEYDDIREELIQELYDVKLSRPLQDMSARGIFNIYKLIKQIE